MNPDVLAWAIVQPIGNRWRGLADAYTGGTTRVTFASSAAVSRRRVRCERRSVLSPVIAPPQFSHNVADLSVTGQDPAVAC